MVFVLMKGISMHKTASPVCAHNVEVTAESTPPEMPITNPLTFAFSA
jgi:hypothetical protein